MILVCSVHHTGTQFVEQVILYKFKNIGNSTSAHIKGIPKGRNMTRVHCELAYVRSLEWWCPQYPIIVPMRHPQKVFESWKVREKNLDHLVRQYHILKKLVAPYNPYYLPIDVFERETWLENINARFGLDIQTNWPVIMSRKQTAVLDTDEIELVQQVMADGFFDQFGYEV